MKALLYSFAGCLYAMQAMLICWAVFLINEIPFGFIFIIAAIIFGIAAFVLGCVNIAFGVSQMSKPKEGVCKTVMIIKLILMPFFVLNFIICFLITAACLNPFLFMALGIVISVMCVLTFGEMIATSSYNLGYLAHKIKYEGSTFGELALLIVSQFLYFFDVVGAIILYIRVKESENV